jgi:hypothetical protein
MLARHLQYNDGGQYFGLKKRIRTRVTGKWVWVAHNNMPVTVIDNRSATLNV